MCYLNIPGNHQTKTGAKSSCGVNYCGWARRFRVGQLDGDVRSGYLDWLRQSSKNRFPSNSRGHSHHTWVQMLVKLQAQTPSSCHWRSVKDYSRYEHLQSKFLTEMHLSFCSVASAGSQPFPTHPLFLGNAPPIHLHNPSASSPGPNASTLSALSPPYLTPVSTEGTRAGFYDKVFCLLFYGPQPMVLNQGWFCSLSGQLEMSGNSSDCHNWREGELTALSGQRPGLLLNILWCTGQPPTIK